ncbi:MAG: ABC transporter permease [Myxococcota bacterium]
MSIASTSGLKFLTFDLYGTVVDMQGGLTEASTPFLKEKGWQGRPHQFVTWWRRTHFENSMIDALCDRGHTSYREIGHRSVSQVMDRAGISYSREDVEWLVAQIEKLRPFPEVTEALGRLESRYGLAILSNGDRDMLSNAAPYVGFEFGAVGLCFAAASPTLPTLTLVFTVVATPLFFFSGSFFPIEVLPAALQPVAWAAPLTPGVHVARGFATGSWDRSHLISAAYLLVLAVAFFPLAVTLLRRRLVK